MRDERNHLYRLLKRREDRIDELKGKLSMKRKREERTDDEGYDSTLKELFDLIRKKKNK